ncbi:MAG: relaxase domain-containing protein [Alphaproteobacteria bacterium]|nr:relaxase domain-containing protein [Alphaproteobacteria bacterium]
MVATVHELASSATAVSYYEKDGYYARNDPEHRQASFWHGRAAADLGLRGHVVPSRFESVLSGQVPKSDIRLGRIVDGERQHRPGWDITFSAPKSVSLEALVMGDERVIRAHDEAVRATLAWIERDLLQTRGWDPATKRRPRVKADGMVVAGFRHLTSRDLDPQLHTHCVLANMTRTADGAWKSIEPTSLRRNEKLIGAHYRNELASRLVAQGFAVTPRMIGPVPGFELAGYDSEFLDTFSGRRREILAYLEKHGLPATRAATQKATLHTRRRKVEAGLAELVPQWRARARALGLARDEAALRPPRPVDPETGREMALPRHPDAGLTKNERRRRRRSPASPNLDPAVEVAAPRRRRRPAAPAERIAEPETGVLEAVARAVAHFEERRTIIPASEIRTLVLGHAPGRYRLEEIDHAIERLVDGGELRETTIRGSDRSFVTDRAVKAERRILKTVRQGKATVDAFAREETVTARLGATTLTDGQANAVRHILRRGDAVVGVQGRAGTGKTTMLKEVAGLSGERSLTGLAPSAAAARVLEKEAGIPTRTLQWFLVRYGDLSDPERLAQAREDLGGTVLAVDEASMIGTVAMERLLAIAGNIGIARVVLVGDTAQLKAVNAGQPFALMQKAGMATAVMDEVLRQKDPDLKEAVARAREGEAGEAMTRLANRVTEHRVEDLGREAARAWLALSAHDRDSCAVLAPTHAIRREINQAIREGLAEEGELTGRTLTLQRLVNRRYTRVEAGVLANYEPGDTVVFHRDAYGCRADDVCTITGTRDGWVVLDHADGRERRFRPSGNAAHNLGVYESRTIEIQAGDRVRWTRNRKARRRTPALVNGEEARVHSIGPERVRLTASDGTQYTLARSDPHLRHLDHAWSSTVHGAQGRTARKVIAVLDAGRMANQEMFYVEVSRASEGFTLLTDDRDALIERLETSPDVPDAALEALGEDLDGPIVDPDDWAALVADWEALEREADGGPPLDLPAYAGVMARIAAFAAVEDLPEDMRAFVDERLAAHESSRAAERQIRELLAGLQAQPRRWPELAWAARSTAGSTDDPPAWQVWRNAGTALVDTTRRMLGYAGAGEPSPDLSAETRRRLEAALARVEAVRLKDDAARFSRDWRRLLERSESEAVPVSLLAGYEALAGRGTALAQSSALTANERHVVDAWQARHAAETALVDDIRSVRTRTGALTKWLAHHIPLDSADGVDPGDADVVQWRHDADQHLRHIRSLLAPGGPHAAHVVAMPEARDGIGKAAGEIGERLRALDRATLLWRIRGIAAHARMMGRLALDMPEWPGTLGEIRDAADTAAPDAPADRHLARWLIHDARWRRDRRHVAAVADRLKDLERGRPRFTDLSDDDAPDRRAWRQEAEAIGDDLAAVGALADHERSAHLAACGMTADAFASLTGAVPLWRATDDALARLDHWSTRTHDVLRDSAQGPTVAPDDANAVRSLIEEGRALPEEWAAASLPEADMEGARGAVEAVIHRLHAAQVTAACQAFDALCRSVNGERKEGHVHPLDAADYPRLLEALEDLAGRQGVPQETRDLMDGWRVADRRWRNERRETATAVARARTLAHAGDALGVGHAGAPDAVTWRAEADALLTAAKAILADDTLKARHLDALTNARRDLAAAVAAIETTLRALDRAALLQRVTEIESRANAAGQLPLDLPEWPSMLEVISEAVAGGAPEDGTMRALARRLDDDRRWRRDRDRVRAVFDRLGDLHARQPRHDGNVEAAMTAGPARKAWVRDFVEAARAIEAATASLTDREHDAHVRACGTTPDQVRQLIDTIPAWQDADTALDRLADWHGRVSKVLRDGPQGPSLRRGDSATASALIEEGKTLPLDATAPFLGDLSAARTVIAESKRRLDAALLNDACTTFVRLTRSVDREAKARGVLPLDTADYPRLVGMLTTLALHEGVPEATLSLVAQWWEADRRWKDERRQVVLLMAEARRLETERTQATDYEGRLSPLSDSWRRDARTLMEDARALYGGERDIHIRAFGGDPGTFDAIIDAIPGWLEADDAVREDAGRDDHLHQLSDAARQVLEQPVSRTIPWNGTEPLVKGDRLTWFDGHRHDAIVDDVGSIDDSGRIDSLVLIPVDDARTGRSGFIMPSNATALARNPSCARAAWPDESLRTREVERQFPATDATFSLPCAGPVVVGDRIRWTLVHPGDGLRSRLDGDTPQIEAVVEGFSPHAVFGADKLVELRVIRSWGRGRPPAPGESIDQRMSELFRRGCVREPWEDEDQRAARVAEFEKEVRRWGRSRGLSM